MPSQTRLSSFRNRSRDQEDFQQTATDRIHHRRNEQASYHNCPHGGPPENAP